MSRNNHTVTSESADEILAVLNDLAGVDRDNSHSDEKLNIDDTFNKNEPFVLASQVEQVFYVDDLFNGPY